MDQFKRIQDMIAQEAFTKAGKKYEKLAEMKSVTEIISEVLNALKKANVKIDSSVAAAKWLAVCAGGSTFVLSSGRIGGVPIMVGGTSTYMTNGFYFCVEKKNGKPKVMHMSNRKIASLYNDDFSAIESDRVEKYAKHVLKYIESSKDEAPSMPTEEPSAE